MAETAEAKIQRLEGRIERLKGTMMSSASRPRIIVGAVAMEEARVNRAFATSLLVAFDRGKDRLIDRKTIEGFVEELETIWNLRSRPSVKPEDRARRSGRVQNCA